MVRMNRTPAFLLNFAHALDHLFLLIFATAVAAIAADFGVARWEDLMPYTTGAFVMFGLASVPARHQHADVRFTRTYSVGVSVGADGEPELPVLMLRLRNETAAGLGLPLPGGGVSLFDTQAGQTLFTGQARFEDKGVGLPVELHFGEAMDLTIEQQTGAEVRTGRITRVPMTVTIRNDKPQPVQIEVWPNEWFYRGFRILTSSARHVITEGGYPAWRLRVPAGGVTTLTYTIEYED